MSQTPTNATADRAGRPFVDGIQALRAVAALAVVLFHSGGAIASAKY